MRSSFAVAADERSRLVAENSHILPASCSWKEDPEDPGFYRLYSSDDGRMAELNALASATDAGFRWEADQQAPAASSAEPQPTE